jgi:hypothetical protein
MKAAMNHDTLRDDPVFKLIAKRLPDDDPLASQPTLSRFENLATPQVCTRPVKHTFAPVTVEASMLTS